MTALPAPRLDPILDAPLVGPRVLSLVGDESGCSMWRVWQPVRFLRLHGYPCDWAFVRYPWLGDLNLRNYDALVLCRMGWHRRDWPDSRRWLTGLKRDGWKIFFEADDDLFSPFMVDQQVARPDKATARAELEADREGATWLLRQCDGVTVSTQYLASTVRRYTDAPVEVVPNAIDAGWFAGVQAEVVRADRRVCIGWAGGGRPDGDLEAMAEAWGRIARRYPEVTFACFGYHPEVIRRHVPAERLRLVPWLYPDHYPMGLVGVDIGCCPLEDRPFNRSKSSIKAYEFALSGAAVVASPTVYGKVLHEGETGFLVTSAGEWEDALAFLLDFPPVRRLVADKLRRQVLERHSLKKHYWRWPAVWNRLWRR